MTGSVLESFHNQTVSAYHHGERFQVIRRRQDCESRQHRGRYRTLKLLKVYRVLSCRYLREIKQRW